jgi:hypothetical protein
MKVPWPYSRCILCLQEMKEGSLTNPPSWEHIIPEQIGGKLSVRFLCKPCNDRLSHDIEPAAKNDPAIRLAVKNLKAQLPDSLVRKIEDGPSIGTGPGGTVSGRITNGTFRVDSVRSQDGSIIQPTPDARAHIERALWKKNFDERRSEEVVRQFDESPENERLELAPGLAAIKWQINAVEPTLVGPFLSHRVLVKIAFEFTACHLGSKAYVESEQLAAIRGSVFDPSPNLEVYSVEELKTQRYAPVHRLKMAGMTPHVVVTIWLFGWLAYRVHLRQIAIPPPHFGYTCSLETGDEQCEILDEEASG